MNTKERILKYLDYLGVGQGAFEKEVGISNGYINNNKGSFGSKTLQKIAEKHPLLDIVWLTTGTGTMIKSNTLGSNSNLTEIENYMEVPVFPSKAQCGDSDEYTNDKFFEDWEKQMIVVDKQYKGRYLLFDIIGDSMDDGTSDSLLDGDRVLGRQVPMVFWVDKLFYKKWKYFAILEKGQRPIIKQVTFHNTDENYIVCHSLNPLFEDRRIELKDVVGIFNIVDQVGGKSKFRA